MGIITRNAPAKSNRSALTIIAEGNKFSGEMSIVGGMHIDGIFEGRISSLDGISIGKRGEVYGDISAHQITVSGLLKGEIFCDELIVESGGKVRGTVHCENMVVEPEGCFIGERCKKASANAETDLKQEDKARAEVLEAGATEPAHDASEAVHNVPLTHSEEETIGEWDKH